MPTINIGNYTIFLFRGM